jgi:hypothetical protein
MKDIKSVWSDFLLALGMVWHQRHIAHRFLIMLILSAGFAHGMTVDAWLFAILAIAYEVKP